MLTDVLEMGVCCGKEAGVVVDEGVHRGGEGGDCRGGWGVRV